MTRAPAVSVVMAVHNGQPYLAEALESVLRQHMTDFELIVVDDASDDGTPEHLAAAARADARIRLARNKCNLGLTVSLNIGLRLATGKYIARMDADDICMPECLARQHAFLEGNPDYAAIACGYQVIDELGRTVRTADGGLDDWQIRWLGGFNPPAPHPTYFFRRTQANGILNLYDEVFWTAQDFELWSRLSLQVKTSVLPEVLVKYRRHQDAITVRKRREQARNCSRTGLENLRRRLPPEIVRQLGPLLKLFAYEAPASREMIAAAIGGCNAMLAHDLNTAPTPRHRRWLRRMAAGLLADAILSRAGGLRSVSSIAAFLYYGRRYLPALVEAVLADPGLAIKSLTNVGKV